MGHANTSGTGLGTLAALMERVAHGSWCALVLVAVLLAACGKGSDAGPTAVPVVPVVPTCDAALSTTPSTAPGRLLVGYTPYGPNWVTPDLAFVRQHSSVISLHTVVNSKVPWDVFVGPYQ